MCWKYGALYETGLTRQEEMMLVLCQALALAFWAPFTAMRKKLPPPSQPLTSLFHTGPNTPSANLPV